MGGVRFGSAELSREMAKSALTFLYGRIIRGAMSMALFNNLERSILSYPFHYLYIVLTTWLLLHTGPALRAFLIPPISGYLISLHRLEYTCFRFTHARLNRWAFLIPLYQSNCYIYIAIK